MNYRTPVINNFPYDNPVTKVACAIGIGWLAYIGISRAKANDKLPQRRKDRQRLMAGPIDKAIDSMNRAWGGPVEATPDVPHYSRHNYARRRRHGK